MSFYKEFDEEEIMEVAKQLHRINTNNKFAKYLMYLMNEDQISVDYIEKFKSLDENISMLDIFIKLA